MRPVILEGPFTTLMPLKPVEMDTLVNCFIEMYEVSFYRNKEVKFGNSSEGAVQMRQGVLLIQVYL